jgi:hypothetical protein
VKNQLSSATTHIQDAHPWGDPSQVKYDPETDVEFLSLASLKGLMSSAVVEVVKAAVALCGDRPLSTS